MTIILILIALFIGFIFGIFLIGILASGKTADMWKAIELAAYNGDTSLCKELLEMEVDNE